MSVAQSRAHLTASPNAEFQRNLRLEQAGINTSIGQWMKKINCFSIVGTLKVEKVEPKDWEKKKIIITPWRRVKSNRPTLVLRVANTYETP